MEEGKRWGVERSGEEKREESQREIVVWLKKMKPKALARTEGRNEIFTTKGHNLV
jgi:hypothetical protein